MPLSMAQPELHQGRVWAVTVLTCQEWCGRHRSARWWHTFGWGTGRGANPPPTRWATVRQPHGHSEARKGPCVGHHPGWPGWETGPAPGVPGRAPRGARPRRTWTTPEDKAQRHPRGPGHGTRTRARSGRKEWEASPRRNGGWPVIRLPGSPSQPEPASRRPTAYRAAQAHNRYASCTGWRTCPVGAG